MIDTFKPADPNMTRGEKAKRIILERTNLDREQTELAELYLKAKIDVLVTERALDEATCSFGRKYRRNFAAYCRAKERCGYLTEACKDSMFKGVYLRFEALNLREEVGTDTEGIAN